MTFNQFSMIENQNVVSPPGEGQNKEYNEELKQIHEMMNTMKNSNLFTEDKNEETYHDLGSYI